MTILAMETTAKSRLYSQLDYTQYYKHRSEKTIQEEDRGGVALVLGNEVTGVDADILQPRQRTNSQEESDGHQENNCSEAPLIDEIIELPTFGRKNSLNVAACAPVVMYEILRQWTKAADDEVGGKGE